MYRDRTGSARKKGYFLEVFSQQRFHVRQLTASSLGDLFYFDKSFSSSAFNLRAPLAKYKTFKISKEDKLVTTPNRRLK